MCMADSPDFVTLYLAAMRIGAIPVPVSTMQRADGLAELLRDSRARLLAVTPEFGVLAHDALGAAPELRGVLAAGGAAVASDAGARPRPRLPRRGGRAEMPASTRRRLTRRPSGSTRRARPARARRRCTGTASVRVVCETYGPQVLGIRPDDRCLSAAKAFFAYGLGNSILFPLSVGACAVLEPAPAKAELIAERAAAVRRDPVLRRADVLRQHAAGRAGAGRDAPRCGWPRRPVRRCPPRCTSGGRPASASTSSTASG